MSRFSFRPPSASMLVSIVALVFVGIGTAVAANTIGSKDVKNNSLRSADIKNNNLRSVDIRNNNLRSVDIRDGQIQQADLHPNTVDALTTEYSNPQWGQIDRNTLGSPTVVLRGGPFVGATEEPPFGIGSLSLTVNGQPRTPDTTSAEQATFGNERDFAGQEVASLNEVGFHVYTTGENNGRGNPNMPAIKFEIDPNLETHTTAFSTLQFMPGNSPSNQWSDYIDGTDADPGPGPRGWFMSGPAGTETNCAPATPCTFEGMQAGLDDGGDAATILSVAVGKGRDFAWAGAVDGLRINDTIYDFEPFGVIERSAG